MVPKPPTNQISSESQPDPEKLKNPRITPDTSVASPLTLSIVQPLGAGATVTSGPNGGIAAAPGMAVAATRAAARAVTSSRCRRVMGSLPSPGSREPAGSRAIIRPPGRRWP